MRVRSCIATSAACQRLSGDSQIASTGNIFITRRPKSMIQAIFRSFRFQPFFIISRSLLLRLAPDPEMSPSV